MSAGMISVSASTRGATSERIASTPITASASSSSRTLRAPRSAVIAVPAAPATTIPATHGANSRSDATENTSPTRSTNPSRSPMLVDWMPGAP